MLRHEPLELGDELSARAELEVGIDPLLQGIQAELLEPADLALREALQLEVAERRAAPQRERLPQRLGSLPRILSPRILNEPLEATEIQLLGLDPEQVAGRLRDEHAGRKELAELRDEVLERGRRRLRALLAPELLDDAIARQHLARVDQQEREERPRSLSSEREWALRPDDLERSEDAELRCPRCAVGLSLGQRRKAWRADPRSRAVRAARAGRSP